jgi:hypothetical protein
MPGLMTLLLSHARKTGGQFVFDVSGVTTGKSVVLQARSTLADHDSWVALRTNVAAATSISLTNLISPSAAFFRACQLP